MKKQIRHTPVICSEQNDLVAALDSNSTVIYLTGETAEQLLKKVKSETKESKHGRFIRNTGIVGMLLSVATGPGILIIGIITTGLGAIASIGKTKKYGVALSEKDGNEIIILVKLKGTNSYDFKNDSIEDTIQVTDGNHCPYCHEKTKIKKRTFCCKLCNHTLIKVYEQ